MSYRCVSFTCSAGPLDCAINLADRQNLWNVNYPVTARRSRMSKQRSLYLTQIHKKILRNKHGSGTNAKQSVDSECVQKIKIAKHNKSESAGTDVERN